MQTEKLQRAIGAIHVRFGDQALTRSDGLPPRPALADRAAPCGPPLRNRRLALRPDQRRRKLLEPGGDRCAEEMDAALERLRARLGLPPSPLPERRSIQPPA